MKQVFNNIKMLVGLAAVVLLMPAAGISQRKEVVTTDTLEALKTFLQLCNDYKKLPIQLHVTIKGSANIITESEDSASHEMEFYMQPHGCYVKSGEVEQLANDSLVLLVSHQARQMVAFPAGSSVQEKLLQSVGFLMGDSSLLKLAARYKAVATPVESGEGTVTVTARTVLSGTDLPREVITVFYKAGKNELQQIEQMRRVLVEVNEQEYNRLQADKAGQFHLLKLQEHYCVVKEVKQTYLFSLIAHQAEARLPVRVSDLVARNASGALIPKGNCAGYNINEN